MTAGETADYADVTDWGARPVSGAGFGVSPKRISRSSLFAYFVGRQSSALFYFHLNAADPLRNEIVYGGANNAEQEPHYTVNDRDKQAKHNH